MPTNTTRTLVSELTGSWVMGFAGTGGPMRAMAAQRGQPKPTEVRRVVVASFLLAASFSRAAAASGADVVT